MGQGIDTTADDKARAAIARGDWDDAFELLRDASADPQASPDRLDLLAQAAYGAGELEAAITAWELAHCAFLARGDAAAAAGTAVTIALYLMMDTGLMSPVRGWIARAERLLEDQDESAVDAMLAMVRTCERLMAGDLQQIGYWAQRTIEIGTRHHAPAAVAIARVATARLHIFEGEVEEGLQLLDEAAVATVSGELDPLAVGIVYCELICAMQGLAQYDRAEQWTEAMDKWRHGTAFGGIHGRCRVHRAEILRLRGSCAEAEDEALHACEELRPWMRREFGWPLTELGTIRLRKGDLAGAEEAFLAAHANGWDPQPGLALLRLAQGDLTAASTLIRGALDQPLNIPSKERPPYGGLGRAPLLEAQTEIEITAGDLTTARRAADELVEVAERFRSTALVASANLAQGRLALCEGNIDAAVVMFQDALRDWCSIGAPYEASRARMALAEAHRANGRHDLALSELQIARQTAEKVGAILLAAEAARACDEKAASTRPTANHVPTRCVFRCEGDTRQVDYNGHSVLIGDLKGMRYLARMLAEPGREFHVLDLIAVERGSLPTVSITANSDVLGSTVDQGDPLLDDQAKQAYRRRLAEVDDDIEEANATGDGERFAAATADRDFLVSELSRAFGLGGRNRHTASSSERARGSVTRAVRYAIERIGTHHQTLAVHLSKTVHTGTYCVYTPDPRVPVNWQL